MVRWSWFLDESKMCFSWPRVTSSGPSHSVKAAPADSVRWRRWFVRRLKAWARPESVERFTSSLCNNSRLSYACVACGILKKETEGADGRCCNVFSSSHFCNRCRSNCGNQYWTILKHLQNKQKTDTNLQDPMIEPNLGWFLLFGKHVRRLIRRSERKSWGKKNEELWRLGKGRRKGGVLLCLGFFWYSWVLMCYWNVLWFALFFWAFFESYFFDSCLMRLVVLFLLISLSSLNLIKITWVDFRSDMLSWIFSLRPCFRWHLQLQEPGVPRFFRMKTQPSCPALWLNCWNHPKRQQLKTTFLTTRKIFDKKSWSLQRSWNCSSRSWIAMGVVRLGAARSGRLVERPSKPSGTN